MKKEKTVEEVLAEYPKEIVDFFHSEVKIGDWYITKKLGGYLPSPAQQLANKFKKIENEITYEIIFTLERRRNESDKNG